MKRLFFFCALVALVSGCASVRVCKEGPTMVDIENTGWFLFNFIPLASGDPDRPNEHTCSLFADNVTLENNMKLLDYAIRREGARGYRNPTSYTTDENVLLILLKRHVYHTSAELIPAGRENLLGGISPN